MLIQIQNTKLEKDDVMLVNCDHTCCMVQNARDRQTKKFKVRRTTKRVQRYSEEGRGEDCVARRARGPE